MSPFNGDRDAAVLLFGSQVESLSKEALDEIRKSLLDDVSRQWILETLAGLPSWLDALAKALPKVTDAIGPDGRQLLVQLESWLRNGEQDGWVLGRSRVPSVVLAPVVVLAQIAQYRRYLALSQARHASVVAQGKASTLGFCMGLLGAFAVASANNDAEVERYGAVAVRLACVGGALIDAQDEWSATKSFALAWTNSKQKESAEGIVKGLAPEAYMSVLYDEARATITTSERAAARLLRQLRAAGITTAEVGFRGDIHNPASQTKAEVDALIAFCNDNPDLQFPDAASLALPTYTNVGHGQPVASTAGSMHEIAYRTVFEHRCDWFNTFASVKAARLDGTDGHVVAFGPDRCVPQTLTRSLDNRVVHFADGGFDVPVVKQQQQQQQQRDAIAVVGMAIKVAGADDVDEFSDMVKTGESQHVEVSRERMRFETLFREGDDDPSRRWFVNPMRDVDAFDHKFFKRSPRESASMDPQQRLMLQATYQALEQAGYFTEDLRNAPDDGRDRKHVAVYIGAPSVDYEHNVGTHSANAFTSTGNLQTVLTGRVAHHFGWTGPAITLDTACSSSAVAIHMACQSLLTGECNAALAGGVALFTNPTWYQNLAAANFLSPTGQCKPFDEKADGFCRAEGISCVFLKRMSDAVADGNPIFGCINSSAVYQNQNSTPMFVPNSPSLSSLFKDVLKKAKVSPADVSLVEAHGTGTPVGDPAEYDAIRRALRGSEVRSKPIPLGSLKGHIGHTEGASGVASLIKVIAMMREKYIPPQASFTKINPAIKALPSDMLEIVTKLRPWNEDRQKVVLINNYGAGGSNAAMLVTEPPASLTSGNNEQQESRLPFFLSGLDLRSIKAYAAKLVSFLESKSQSYTLADLSFGIDRHSNPDLSQSLVFSCRSVSELKEKISSVASAKTTKSSELGIESSKPERPVILCFGGQVSTFVGLDRKLYESVAVLRNHLDKCDAIIQSQLGLGSMYPDIFSRTPFTDPVRLQTMLFSIQYASAKSWIDCGLSGKVAAVVGHSFGELTALCISGAVSLEDAIKMVGRRAQLIRDSWGSDKGAMMAVEADESLVQELLAESGSHLHGQNDGASHTPAAIACYNGPRSFTLAGSVKCIDAVAETLAKNDRFSAIKNKRLNVTNAFHSSLVDPLVDSLEQVGKELAFQEPSIPLERATETRVSGTPTPEFVADHMRQPVFFNHAIQRLAKDYPSAIFLEAGSNSTITVMANRALMGQAASGTAHHFQAVNITNGGGLDGLTDATTALWKQGLRVSFWAHHAQQTNGYAPLLLPPYQFEKTRHWLERKSMADAVAKAAAELAGKTQPTVQADEQKDDALCKFVGYQGRDKTPRFSINSDSPKYRELLAGHIIAQTAPISPSTLQFDMAIESLFSLHPEWKAAGLVPVLHDLVNHSPLCADQSRVWWLDYKPLDAAESQWEWKISSTLHNGSQTQQHTQGRLHIRSPEDEAFIAEFARFERLVNFAPCAALLAAAGRDGESDDIDVLQGRNIYRAFAEMVDYSDIYRGVRTVIGRGDECAGRVHRRHSGETWVDVLLDDCFSQVSGIWVNLMTDAGDGEMYVSSGCELSMRSPRRLVQPGSTQEHWHVYGRSTKKSDTSFVSDVFVFDASTGQLAQVVLGIQYSKVPMASMSRMLSNLTKDPSVMVKKAAAVANQPQRTSGAKAAALPSTVPATAPVSKSKKTQKKKTKKANASTPKRPEITEEVRKLVANVSGMELGDITLDSQLADIGIDSLMGMEMCREIDLVFKCTVDQGQLLQATSVRQLVEFILKYVPTPASDVPEQEEEEEEGEEEEVEEVVTTTAPKPGQAFSGEEEVRKIVATVSGMPADEVTLDTQLADIGIDSLMGMELCREIDLIFKSAVDQGRLLQATSVRQLIDFVSEMVGGAEFATATTTTTNHPSSDESDDDEDNDSWSNVTPPSRDSVVAEIGKPAAGSDSDVVAALTAADVLESFGEVKLKTDKGFCDHHLDNVDRVVIAATSRLCVALIVEAFEKLGCSLGAAATGDKIKRVPYLPEYESLMKWTYGFLVNDARLLDMDAATGQLTRTAIPVPSSSSEKILEELLEAYPSWDMASKLTYLAGKPLADVLSGATDGIRVLFGTAEARDLVAALYRDHPLNVMLAGQMREFLGRVAERVEAGKTLKILEMGAGTGGTTDVLVPFLASLGVSLEYTFTDLSSSMVAAARRKYSKQYPFMKFAVHDIEKAPAEELRGQHVILASNAVHATHNLVESTTNIHKALRPDGFLMLLEQTECMPFSNPIFGLLEGWWMFNDGRSHATVSAEHWERDLHKAGFGHVDWTDGHLPENHIERVIVALASGPPHERLPIPMSRPEQQPLGSKPRDLATRLADAERYVAEHTAGWASKQLEETAERPAPVNRDDAVVIVTGASGSLGSHLVAAFAENASVKAVVCVNRHNSVPAEKRQLDALSRRGISLSPDAQAKLRVLETDMSRPQLGLAAAEYDWLVQNGTHVVHNAWPMSATRPIAAFVPQFQTMRSLLDLAREMALANTQRRVGFQLVTSIGVTGKAGVPRVPEERLPLAATLPTGYCEGKWVCERMLDATLHQYPSIFRPMVVRPGQIAGSTSSGYWNPVEHFPFLVKSSQAVRAFPAFSGRMQWVPVDAAAAGMAELLFIGAEATAPPPSAVYHIDNPVGQRWEDVSHVLADAIGAEGVVPFRQWLRLVSRSPLPATENPAAQIFDFLDREFERMSCGGQILDTTRVKEHSKTMDALGPVSAEAVRGYVRSWKEMGFLK